MGTHASTQYIDFVETAHKVDEKDSCGDPLEDMDGANAMEFCKF